jgi:hypothetical protein
MQQATYTDHRGYRHNALPLAEVVAKRGIDVKHEIKLLKRRLAYARNVETPRVFPSPEALQHRLLIEMQGPLNVFNNDGDFSSPDITRWYVQQFCAANHLKGA